MVDWAMVQVWMLIGMIAASILICLCAAVYDGCCHPHHHYDLQPLDDQLLVPITTLTAPSTWGRGAVHGRQQPIALDSIFVPSARALPLLTPTPRTTAIMGPLVTGGMSTPTHSLNRSPDSSEDDVPWQSEGHSEGHSEDDELGERSLEARLLRESPAPFDIEF